MRPNSVPIERYLKKRGIQAKWPSTVALLGSIFLGGALAFFPLVGKEAAAQWDRDGTGAPYKTLSDQRRDPQDRPPVLREPPSIPRNLPPPPHDRSSGTRSRLTPEDKARLQERLREFRSMPPERRHDIIQRFEQWKSLPPQERELYKRRFEQWKSLPREDQLRLRQKLKEPEKLTPQEKEELRKKFLGH
jgi:hypothetical protein